MREWLGKHCAWVTHFLRPYWLVLAFSPDEIILALVDNFLSKLNYDNNWCVGPAEGTAPPHASALLKARLIPTRRPCWRHCSSPRVGPAEDTALFCVSSSVWLSYFILAVPMRKCLGKHSCMSSSFPIAILNDTSFFWQCNYKCTLRIRRDMVEIRTR